MKHIIRPVRSLIQSSSIKTKLLLVTLALIVFPLSVTCIIMYKYTTDMYANNVYNLSSMSMEYTAEVMESKLSTALNTANLVAINPDVQQILSKDPKDYGLEEQLNDMKILATYLQSLERDSNIQRVRITAPEGLIYSNDSQHFINIERLGEYQWFNDISNGQIRLYPCYWVRNIADGVENVPNALDVVSCVKVIHSINDFDKILGFVFVDIPIKSLNTALLKADLTNDAFICAIDQKGENMVSAGRVNDMKKALDLAGSVEIFNKRDLDIGNVKYQVHFQDLRMFGWRIVSFVPLQIIQNERNKTAAFTLALLVFLAGATLLMSSFIYKNALNRIKQIVKSMKKVQEGNLDVELPVTSDDEIGRIERNYNFMIRRIKNLINETYILVGKTREAEFKALQAQINPHFLYNTINTISWTAMDYGAEKVCYMLKALSDFYKLGLQPDKQEVSIEDEIRHVELYTEIQNMRYRDSIILQVDVPDELKKNLMPNMILQPLVENSILHGILARSDRRGKILLRGTGFEGDIILSVIDDGAGMNSETLDKLVKHNSPGEDYGVYNIHERLRLKYGEKYGLHIESHPGRGTRVDIRIPNILPPSV